MDETLAVPPPNVAGWLATTGYEPPTETHQVRLDVVTPTCDRPKELELQAARIGSQLNPHDRWIVVDDSSQTGFPLGRVFKAFGPNAEPLFVTLSYRKGDAVGTVNRARHVGCTLARTGAWIVEVDDHDLLYNGALELIREAIVRGATMVYGDVLLTPGLDAAGKIFAKPDYTPWLLRDGMCPCSGVRAFPKFLYDAAGGYRWCGERAVGGNEFPAGDYGLFMRIEQLCEGQGFYRIPQVLCQTPYVAGGISTRYVTQQAEMAKQLRRAAASGELM